MVLDRCQERLRASHEGPPSHNTVLGHSYGSTVVGYIPRVHGPDADELVFVGSPGVGGVPMKTRARIAAVALAVGLVAGCATPGQNPGLDSQGAPVPTPTYAAAVERVERLLSDAAGFLTPTPQLTLVEDLDIPCLDAGAEGSQFNDQVQPGRSYFVGGLPTDRTVAELVSGLTEHWTAQGYRISRDERPQNQTVAVSDPAGFGLTVNVNPAGDLAPIASSPCVSPESPGR